MAVLAPDSRSAGILQPTEYVGNVDDILRDHVAGVTGMPVKNVRRRWLRRTGVQPHIDDDWAAVGVTSVETLGTPQQRRVGAAENIEAVSHQTLHCVASFYGPRAMLLADRLREGLQIEQTNSALCSNGLTLQAVEPDIQHLPDLFGAEWVDRFDVSFRIGRQVKRIYGIRTLVSADDVTIHTEKDV